MDSLILLKQEVDVNQWVSCVKLSYTEVCKKFGLDIVGDRRNAFFWNMMSNTKLVVNEDLLAWCGYSGEYKNMKNNFLSLLKKNLHILYNEIEDVHYKKKRYIVMDPLDFESLLMQMRSQKAREIRELYSFLKHVSFQYTKYEKFYEAHRNELMARQNHELTQSVHELKDLVLQVKKNSDLELDQAEAERNRAETERNRAETERNRAEAWHMEEVEERRRAEKRHSELSVELNAIKKRIRTEVVDKLRTEIAPLVAPPPINLNKERVLGLICVRPQKEWYIIRRQRESFNKAVGVLVRKHAPDAELVKEWHRVAHAVDVGNSVKLRLRNLKWMARGNILRIVDDSDVIYCNEDLIHIIEEILRNNVAVDLSNDTSEMIN